MTKPLQISRTAVFISGRGSNLQSLLDQCADVQLVVSSKDQAPGVLKAKRFGVPVLIWNKSWTDLSDELKKRKINRIFLLGFMKIIPASFIQEWTDVIFNIHPSLLPEFKGNKAFERSVESKSNLGVSFHLVNEKLDEGKVLIQKKFFHKNDWQKNFSLDFIQLGLAFAEKRVVSEGVRRCL